MKAKRLTAEIDKARRFLPANLDEVNVEILKTVKRVTFCYIKEDKLIYQFTIKED